MAKRRSKKKTKQAVISTVVSLLIVGIVVGGYFVYRYYFTPQEEPNPEPEPPVELPTDLGEANVTKYVSWNSEFSTPKDSVFYQSSKEEIESYYSKVDFNEAMKDETKEDFFVDMQALLSADFIKPNYSGNNSKYPGGNKTWANYFLADRDFESSPLTKEEVTSGEWSKDVMVDILYREDNISSTTFSKENKVDREHIVPKSYGFNMEGTGYQKLDAGCDLHNLRSSDHVGNSTAHNNRLYDDIKTEEGVKTVQDPDGKSESYYNDDYFEPQDEDKGEIARAVFYMAVKYRYYEEGGDGLTEGPALRLSDDAVKIDSTIIPADTKDNPAEFGVLSTLLEWNQLDPVNENEMVRNNVVYHIQGNRNPFVDYPNLANILFA